MPQGSPNEHITATSVVLSCSLSAHSTLLHRLSTYGQLRYVHCRHLVTSVLRATPIVNISKVIGAKKNIPYIDRTSVRVVAKNEKDEIAIIFVKNGNYYKLPGGGMEANEDHRATGEREMMEETGCKVTMYGDCMATTEEWRDHLHQISYCYRASLIDDSGMPNLTSEEIEDGFEHEWISVEGAIRKMMECQPTSELGRYIKERDLYLVQTYTNIV